MENFVIFMVILCAIELIGGMITLMNVADGGELAQRTPGSVASNTFFFAAIGIWAFVVLLHRSLKGLLSLKSMRPLSMVSVFV